MKTLRKSNIELLRILAMFLVMVIHYVPLRNQKATSFNNDLYSIFTYELNSLSIVCVNVFIIISGYFGIKWKWKSFFNYIFQVFFWVILTYIISILIKTEHYNTKILLNKIVTFLSYNYFILSYLGLYLFAPVLNAYIENVSDKQLGYFIFIYYIFSTVFGYILQVSPEIKEGCTFVSFMGLYLIGSYIKKGKSRILCFNKWKDLMIYMILGFLLVLITYFSKFIGFSHSVYGYLNPIVIIQSVYIFLFFSKINIQNKVINWIAYSSFSVFLFHFNPSIYPTYKKICINIINNYTYDFPIIFIFLILIFIVSVLLDKIRIQIFNSILTIRLKK